MPAAGRLAIGGLLLVKENIMEMVVKAKVTGVKRFKGNIEGTDYDSTTIFVETDLDDGAGNARGTATQSFRFGDSTEFDRLQSVPLPFDAQIKMRQVTNGKNRASMEVLGVQPIKAAG